MKIGQEAFVGYKLSENTTSIQLGTWNGKEFMMGLKGSEYNKTIIKNVVSGCLIGKFGVSDGKSFVIEDGKFVWNSHFPKLQKTVTN